MKIAFCFLIKNKINYENIWFEYLKGHESLEIIIHSAEKIELDYLPSLTKNIYIKQVPTEWGRLLKVENFLMEKSKELNCDKCIFLSDSCLPVKSLSYIEDFLNNDFSYISNRKPWVLSRFPVQIREYAYLMGNHQWIIIDKKHYDLFLSSYLRHTFENDVFFPEESYHATVLQANNLNNEDNVCNIITTYTDWDRPTNYNRSPYVFNLDDYDTTDLQKVLSNSEHLFIRKVAENGQTTFIDTLRSGILVS